MDTVVRVYNLFFDSKYRTEDSENYHPDFELQSQIVLSNPNNYFDFELVAADVPFSFYMLDIPNNVIRVRVERDLDTWQGEISIASGNYNINTLCQAFCNALVAAYTNLPAGTVPIITYSYDAEEGKVTFNIGGGIPGVQYRVIIYWIDYDIFAQYFGFSFTVFTELKLVGVVETNTDNVSPYVVCVNPITSVYLRSLTLNQSLDNQELLVDQTSSVSNILGKVAINGSSLTWLFYETYDFKIKLRNTEIKKFDLFWTGLTYDEIRFRGVFWKIQVRIREMQPAAVGQLLALQATSAQQAELEAQNLAMAKRKLEEEAAARVNKIRRKVESKLPID